MRAHPSALLLVSLMASPAFAQRICVVPFTGPGGPPIRNQVIAGVCERADCVAPPKATSGNKPDWKKAKKEAVLYFVTGTVAKKGKATNLTLQVLAKAGKPKWSKVYPVEGGELSAATLSTALTGLKAALGGPAEKAPEPEPVPSKPAQPVAQPEPLPQPVRAAEPAPATAAPPAERTSDKDERRQHFVAIELGADLLLRSFGYKDLTSSNLRSYDSFFALPAAHLELFPLALSSRGIVAGLGLEGGISLATWLKSGRKNTTDAFPTSTMRIDAGLVWRIMPLSSIDLAFYPIVGIRLHSFTVGAMPDGTRLEGLPGLNYFGLRGGLGVDVPLLDKRVVIFARFVVIPVFRSGEIMSSAYFSGGGSNFGLEGNAGVGIRIVNHLYVRLAFDFTRYSLTLKSSPTDTYAASGATDQYLGGTASLRFEY